MVWREPYVRSRTLAGEDCRQTIIKTDSMVTWHCPPTRTPRRRHRGALPISFGPASQASHNLPYLVIIRHSCLRCYRTTYLSSFSRLNQESSPTWRRMAFRNVLVFSLNNFHSRLPPRSIRLSVGLLSQSLSLCPWLTGTIDIQHESAQKSSFDGDNVPWMRDLTSIWRESIYTYSVKFVNL